ncbi:MAG: cysteine dioxygenase family protein [Phycisphaerales bacterium]|nr:MAG: cysteine dioxygenase family protein [Phycisphaerales bacterium]
MVSAQTSCPNATRNYPKLAEVIDYLGSLQSRADLAILSDLLSKLNVSRHDIAPACVFGARGYRRNTICETQWFELLALCWRSGDCTPIHDHRGVSCAFRIVEGTGTEIRFQKTPSGLVCPVEAISMPPGYVCAADEPDIHQVSNMQAPGKDLITLHIYSPPIQKMNTYRFAQSVSAECADRYDNCEIASDDMPC